MNLQEELLTSSWSEFVVKNRGYDILIRNLTVRGTEYDAVGANTDGEKFSDSPRLENIETKLAKSEALSRSSRKLADQLNRRIQLGAFSGYIGLCNLEEALPRLPPQAGSGAVTLLKPGVPGIGKFLRIPPSLPVKQINYEPIRDAVRQVYSAAKAIGLPCIFAKCQRRDCKNYYGFEARIPLPEMIDEDGHSSYCPQNKHTSRRYAFASKGFYVGNTTFQVVREIKTV